LKEKAKSSPLPHIFSDIVVDDPLESELAKKMRAYQAELQMTPWQRNKIQAAIEKACAPQTKTSRLLSCIHTIMKRDALLKLYINNFIKVIAKPSIDEQMFILSKLQNFLNKVVGKISIQAFINRYTKQSIQLLPAY